MSSDRIDLYSFKRIGSSFGALSICILFCLSYISWGVDRFFSSIYAEDGAIYIQEALETGPLVSIANTYAGYLDIPARIIGATVTLFHPMSYALVNSILLLLCLSLYQWITYHIFYSITKSKF